MCKSWTARHENVHYFPSYEIVQNSDRVDLAARAGENDQPYHEQLSKHLFGMTAAHSNYDDMMKAKNAGELRRC